MAAGENLLIPLVFLAVVSVAEVAKRASVRLESSLCVRVALLAAKVARLQKLHWTMATRCRACLKRVNL